MARLNQTQRKAMIRAFGIASAVLELNGREFGGIPDSFLDKKTFRSAHDLFIAGVEAKRSGRALIARERKSDTFMAAYRLAGGTVQPTECDSAALAGSAVPADPKRPPFSIADNAVAMWSAPHWIVRTGDTVELFEKRRGEWVAVAKKNTPACCDSPDWHRGMYEGTVWLSGPNVKDHAVIKDFAESLFEVALEPGGEREFEPNTEDHSQVAKLRAEIAAGRAAFLDGKRRPRTSTFAFELGYNMAEEFGKKSA